MSVSADKHICQVAFSAHDAPALRQWYANVFGLVKSGKIIFFPPSTTQVQGVAGAWEKCSWLIDQQDYFQLEFFQFLKPRGKLKSLAWSPCDIGYNMVGLAVNDFDQTLRNVCAFSAVDQPQICGEPGERRACVIDPEGNHVEIYERDPLSMIEGARTDVLRPEVGAVVRTVRVSVPSLEDARKTYVDAMGLQVVEDFALHTADDEGMWGLEDVSATSLVVRGSNFLVELVEYQAPQPASWPENYCLADQGIMNIALGYRDNQDYDRSFTQATEHGMLPNGEVVESGLMKVMYVNDPHGFSVEMLNARKAFWSITGFNSHEAYVENEIEIDAPIVEVWQRLTDHAAMGGWSIFNCRLLREGRVNPNGVGCIRELTAFGSRITEEVTAWDEGEHYSYQLRTGAPFRKHQGDIFVSSKNGRTQVRWAIRLESWIPCSGRITAWALRLLFARDLKNLKGQLEG